MRSATAIAAALLMLGAQAAIVENKHLGAALAHIRERQDAYGPAWNVDRRHATRNNLRRAAEWSGLTSLSGAAP